MSTHAPEGRLPLSEQVVRRSSVPVRTRFGRLFGLSGKDVEAARKRLMAALAEVRASTDESFSSLEDSQAVGSEARTESTSVVAGEAATQQGLLFDQDLSRLPADAGYRGPTACNAAGITYRQLEYWARTGLVEPSLRAEAGSGAHRLYSFRDILLLKTVKSLLDAGISLEQSRTAVAHLRSRDTDDLTRVTLMSDGHSVYECASNDEVIDLLQHGEGVFGIAIGGVWREVEGSLARLPSERAGDLATGASGLGRASRPAPAHTEDPAAGKQSQTTFADVRKDLIRSLAEVDKLPPERQAEVAALLQDLHLTDNLRSFANVIDLDSQRTQRERSGRSSADEGPSTTSAGS